MNRPNTKLIFRLGKESIPTVMSAEELAESPFAETIHAAERRIKSLARQLREETCNREDTNDTKWLDTTPNNIVAFFGDRGAGKTSCMRTLVSMLREEQDFAKRNGTAGGNEWFFTEEIDPSFFDENHNVLELLIGSLYGDFNKDCRDIDRKKMKEKEVLRSIQEKFLKVKKALRFLDSTPDLKDEYEIDELNHLNDGGNLRSLLKDLISEILAYKKHRFLVITIDDLDLNIKEGYKMMELIRKHLILPNVIVVIAAKYTQLFDSVCRDLTSIYKGLEHRVGHKDIAEMTERYLNKMFPLDQRFEMPSVDSYMDAELAIIDEEGATKYEKEDVKLTVPSIIFEKTRFLFYNSSGMPSLVIPRNLRDLRMLVSMLVQLKPYSKDTQAYNKSIFKDYFFNEWLGIIEPAHRPFAKGLLEEDNLSKINRFVIRNLYDFFLSKIETFDTLKANTEKTLENSSRPTSLLNERELLVAILTPTNSYWNVSVGDVVFVLNTVRKLYDSPEVLAILFFIESFYSIKLYETYDRLTDMTSNDGLVTDKEDPTTAPELKTSVRGEMPEYFRLTGGGFMSPTGDYFISYPAKGARSREYTMINGQFLMDEIRSVEKEYRSIHESQSDPQKRTIPEWLSRRLRLCEFFMLTVKYLDEARKPGENLRTANEPLYFKDFGNSAKYLVFDVTVPFLNAIYPEFAYRRFSQNIYKYAKEDENSLLRRMTRHHLRHKPNETWELMSKAAIRNMEILEDLTAWLHKNKEDGKLTGSSEPGVIRDFYLQFRIPEEQENTTDPSTDSTQNPTPETQTIKEDSIPAGRYWVKTYSKVNDAAADPDHLPYYYIHYSIFSLLGDVMEELDMPYDATGDKPVDGSAPENAPANSSNGKPGGRRGSYIFASIMSPDIILKQQDEYSSEELKEALSPYISRAILNGAIPDGDKLDINSTAKILANIRIDFRYDFSGKLPPLLQLSYDAYTDTIGAEMLASDTNRMNQIEDEIADLQTKQKRESERIKKLNQDIAKLESDKDKTDEEAIATNNEIAEQHDYLDFLWNRLNSNLDKTEYNRLRKEEENIQKLLISANHSLKNLPAKKMLIISKIDKAKDRIAESKKTLMELEKQLRTLQKVKQDIAKSIQELKFRINSPIAIEIR